MWRSVASLASVEHSARWDSTWTRRDSHRSAVHLLCASHILTRPDHATSAILLVHTCEARLARLASNRGRLQAVSILICTQATAGLEHESMQVHRMTLAVLPQSVVLNTAYKRLIGWCRNGVRWRCRASPVVHPCSFARPPQADLDPPIAPATQQQPTFAA